MTANAAALLPGAVVLLDAESAHLGFARGDRATVVRCEQDRYFTVRIHRTNARLAFSPDELILVPPQPGSEYGCCEHIDCPDTCLGHPTPCRLCEQSLQETADRRAARDMAVES